MSHPVRRMSVFTLGALAALLAGCGQADPVAEKVQRAEQAAQRAEAAQAEAEKILAETKRLASSAPKAAAAPEPDPTFEADKDSQNTNSALVDNANGDSDTGG